MELINLGSFETKGSLIVTDPCYEAKKEQIISVAPGRYDAFVLLGKLKDPIFAWDKIPHNSRVAKLVIIRQDYEGELTFSKSPVHVSVDSGQAGFFNTEFYKKPSEVAVKNDGELHDFFRENVTSSMVRIEKLKKDLLEDGRRVQRYQESYKEGIEKARAMVQADIANEEEMMAEDLKSLESKKYPSYLEERNLKKFYDVMCDFTSREFYGDVHEDYGVVSRSGEGDGGYDLYLGRDSSGEVLGAQINFISFKDLK